MKEVSFEINESSHKSKGRVRQVHLASHDANELDYRDLLLIAVRCVQLVGDEQGLDKAIEMLNKRLYKNRRTKKRRTDA